jgi:hypothetical protein
MSPSTAGDGVSATAPAGPATAVARVATDLARISPPNRDTARTRVAEEAVEARPGVAATLALAEPMRTTLPSAGYAYGPPPDLAGGASIEVARSSAVRGTTIRATIADAVARGSSGAAAATAAATTTAAEPIAASGSSVRLTEKG